MPNGIALVIICAVIVGLVLLFARKRKGTGPVDSPVDYGPTP